MLKTYNPVRTSLFFACSLLALSVAAPSIAQAQGGERPSLIITNDPVPQDIRSTVYSKPARVPDIRPEDIAGGNYYQPTQTLVTRKIVDLNNELNILQSNVANLSSALANLQRGNEAKAAEYYSAVATINTQLQAGTTPGNPRLLNRISSAESVLGEFSGTVSSLNQLAIEASDTASRASFLLDETRATYNLSGAVEEDHVRLAEVEDSINNTVVIIDRVLNNISDDLSRTSAYLASERSNLRALSLAVSNGDLYGKSLTNRPFSSVGQFSGGAVEPASFNGSTGQVSQQSSVSGLNGPRALVKIRFDRADVNYEQPLYTAVSEALQRYPDARFDLVAIHPSGGNAAQVAIESTRARRNAERVLRTLTELGLPLERVDLSYDKSAQATTNEVHVYVK